MILSLGELIGCKNVCFINFIINYPYDAIFSNNLFAHMNV